MRTVTIYSLIDPRDEIIKYIGKTVQKEARYRQHIYQWKRDKGRHNKVNSWIKSLHNHGLKPLFEIIDECPESEWKEYERGYIALLKSCGATLKNSTNGGDEPPTNVNSPESKKKRLETLKTSKAWKGWHSAHSERMKEYYKQGKLGIGKLSEEAKQRQREKISLNSSFNRSLTIRIKETGEVLEFRSIILFAKHLGYKSANSVKDFLFNKRKTHLSLKYEVLEIKPHQKPKSSK
jgi:hypothetical protein